MRLINADALQESFYINCAEECSICEFYKNGVCNLIKKQATVYMWHDLRKNPDDLPNANVEVLIAYAYSHNSKNFKYRLVNAKRNTGFSHVGIKDLIVAWCYLPRFNG